MKRIIVSLCYAFVLFTACVKQSQKDSFSSYDSFNNEAIISSFSHSEINNGSLVTLPNGIVLDKIGSLYYWDDMVFSDDRLDYLCPEMNRSGYTNGTSYYWPYGIVYYTFNSNFPDTTYAHNAMAEISSSTSIVFKPRVTQTNYIEFKYSTKNNSYVGMQSGKQIVNIINYNNKSVIEHELLHSLGFFHEHCRSDRDNYIIVNFSNIRLAKRHNYQKEVNSINIDTLDFNSIMLYSSYVTDPSFVYDTTIPTMTKINGDPFVQGTTLSGSDIAGISSIYGPPYHRLESRLIRVVEDSVSGNIEHYITENADSLVFYADKNCTVRQALQYPRKVGVVVNHMYNQGHGYVEDLEYYDVTIPAGTTAYCLRHGYNYYLYFASDPDTGYDVKQYSIRNILVQSVNY